MVIGIVLAVVVNPHNGVILALVECMHRVEVILVVEASLMLICRR